jgi:hypothetical protein
MVRNIRFSLMTMLILAAVMTITVEAQISVVVSKSSNQSATQSELKQMFAGVRLTWSGGEKMTIADQSDTEVGKTFYDKFIGKSVSQVRTEWTKLVLSGQASAPKKCSNDDAVKKALADNPNAVGYISSSSLDGTVKEIHRVN